MKKKKNNYISYLKHICRIIYFHVKLIEYKLENKIPLTRYEEDILSFFEEHEDIIMNLERIEYNEK